MKTLFSKKISIVAAIVTIAITAGILAGCQKEESKADIIVNSKEFQDFAYNVIQLGSTIKFSYKNLSDSDWNKFKQILNNISTGNFENQEELDAIFNELKSVSNIDFKEQIGIIKKSMLKLPDNVNELSQDDIIMAFERNGFAKGKNTPRLKNGNEDDPIQYDSACFAKCTALYVGAMIVCDTVALPAWPACVALATWGYSECLEGCEI